MGTPTRHCTCANTFLNLPYNRDQCQSVQLSVYIFYASGFKYVGYLKSHDKLARATHGLAELITIGMHAYVAGSNRRQVYMQWGHGPFAWLAVSSDSSSSESAPPLPWLWGSSDGGSSKATWDGEGQSAVPTEFAVFRPDPSLLVPAVRVPAASLPTRLRDEARVVRQPSIPTCEVPKKQWRVAPGCPEVRKGVACRVRQAHAPSPPGISCQWPARTRDGRRQRNIHE